MLIEYINKAMSKAVYEKLEDGTHSGKIPRCPGVIAFGESLYQCQEGLRSVLEGWLIVKIRHGDKLPVIGGINLNNKMPALKEVAAHREMDAVQTKGFHCEIEENWCRITRTGWTTFLHAARSIYTYSPQ